MAAKDAEFNPHLEARAVDKRAREAERKRLAGIAEATKPRGKIPPAVKGRVRYVASEDTVTPDGKHHRPGDVFSVPKDTEPSQTWHPYEEA